VQIFTLRSFLWLLPGLFLVAQNGSGFLLEDVVERCPVTGLRFAVGRGLYRLTRPLGFTKPHEELPISLAVDRNPQADGCAGLRL
jgi:hypothetical protein